MARRRATIASPETIDHHTRRIALATMLDDVDRKILSFIEAYNVQTGNAPTTRQISIVIDRANEPTNRRLRRLAAIGLLRRVEETGERRAMYLPNLPGRVYCQDFE